MNTSKVDKEKLQSKKIKGGGVNLFISHLLLIVTTIAIIIFLGCQFGCNKKEKTYSLPVNTTFYKFSGSNNDVVEGFSTSFLAASDTDENARQYMVDNADWGVTINDTFGISMDLHGQKITGTKWAFSPEGEDAVLANINNIFVNFTYLNFANTLWQWDVDGYSGNWTFGATSKTKAANFSNVRTLNLQNANFAIAIDDQSSAQQVLSAHDTFATANFNKLTTLNLQGANFAPTTAIKNVGTADSTFMGAKFDNLVTLDLRGVSFATSNMGTGGKMYTALLTFYSAVFTSLTNLTLNGARFTWSNMSTVAKVDPGYLTFQNSILAKLHNLDLGDCMCVEEGVGPSSSEDNFITLHTFQNLNDSRGWDNQDKLNVVGQYDWATKQADVLNEWFGEDCWNFTSY